MVIIIGYQSFQNVYNIHSSPPTISSPPIIESHRARAMVFVSGGSVTNVRVTDPGQGYQRSPRIRFYGGGGKDAEAFADITDGKIREITITNGGTGYQNSPEIIFEDVDDGNGATAKACIDDDSTIKRIDVITSGKKYRTVPSVYIVGGGGSNATAVAKVVDGHVKGIEVTNPGNDYNRTPTVIIVPSSSKKSQESQGIVKNYLQRRLARDKILQNRLLAEIKK